VLRILLANAVVLAAGQGFVYAVEANDLGMYVSGGIVLGAQCALVAVLAVLNALRWVVFRTRWHFRRFLGWALAAVLVPMVGGGVWLALVEAMPAFWRQ
jgi:hypothetical protein